MNAFRFSIQRIIRNPVLNIAVSCVRKIRNGCKRLISEFIYSKLICKKASLPFTDLQGLASDIPLDIFYALKRNYFPSNHYYGNEDILRKYAHIPDHWKLNLTIEHGIALNNFCWVQGEIDVKGNSGVIVSSRYREKVVKQHTNKPIYNIGRLILYADSYLDDISFKELKKKWGKVLLYFPVHSTHFTTAFPDKNIAWDQINQITEFDTIVVCLYWKDILNGVAEFYKSKKCICVTAGHIFDPLFLSRLRSIIELADMTVCDEVCGSFGNSLALGKPCMVLNNSCIRKFDVESDKSEFKNIDEDVNWRKLNNLFNHPYRTLSEEQFQAVDYYYGLTKKCSPEEIRSIFMRHLRK